VDPSFETEKDGYFNHGLAYQTLKLDLILKSIIFQIGLCELAFHVGAHMGRGSHRFMAAQGY